MDRKRTPFTEQVPLKTQYNPSRNANENEPLESEKKSLAVVSKRRMQGKLVPINRFRTKVNVSGIQSK